MVEIDTLFQTKTAKKTPFSTTHTYIAYIRDYLPPGAKNALQIMSLAAYASETNYNTIVYTNRLWALRAVTQSARSLQSQDKIGDCEQYILPTNKCFPPTWCEYCGQ